MFQTHLNISPITRKKKRGENSTPTFGKITESNQPGQEIMTTFFGIHVYKLLLVMIKDVFFLENLVILAHPDQEICELV